MQTPACLNSAHPFYSGTHIWVFSTLMLCFLVNPKIWHPRYLSKRALKLACIRKQKLMSRGNGEIHCHTTLLSLCNQTVSWREDLHSNHYLMTHFHVSTYCWKNAVIFLTHRKMRCFKAVLTPQLSGTNQWHSGHSPAFQSRWGKTVRAFISRNLNNTKQLKFHGFLRTCLKNWKMLVRGFPGPHFLSPSPPHIHQDTASVLKSSSTHPKLLKCRFLISN